jgi:GntR family transcriptional regulator/MocR family aminotransferase
MKQLQERAVETKETLRRQICTHFIRSIESGELPPGSPLPPSRELAKQLGVSRDTVVRGFSDLQSMFYIESSSTRGFFVSRRDYEGATEGARLPEPGSIRLSAYGQRLLTGRQRFLFTPDFSPLNYGAPPRDLLPMRRWQFHLKTFAESVTQFSFKPEVFGLAELRESMAGFLNRSKMLGCTSNDIMLFSGTLTAMNLLCRLLVNPGEIVAVEEPGFGGFRNIATEHGCELLKIPVDQDGMLVDMLEEASNVRLVYLTPAHHDPTGVVLSEARRKQLLAWAQKNDAWIIEDDFDGHFSYDTKRPLPCLKSLDKNNRVIYLSSLWKVLYPLSSIGYCILPKQLIALVEKVKINSDGFSEILAQRVLASMIDEGYLERHIRRLQNIYKNRRTSLIYELKKAFGHRIAIQGETKGTYSLVTFLDWTDEAILQAARISGLPLISIASYYFEDAPEGEFIVDFSCIPEDEMSKIVLKFGKILQNA